MRSMIEAIGRRILATLAAGAVVLGLSTAPGTARADEPVWLTVTGNAEVLAESNRADFDAFDDAFIAFHDREFERAVAFTRADLARLPQVSITARAEDWPRAVRATGPRLADVLAIAGVAESARIAVVALDGYAAEIAPAARAAEEWVLAIEADGQPLGIGGRGPVWLLQPTGEAIADSDREANWVWSVFLIEVGDD